MGESLFTTSHATISDCGRYRYSLERIWDPSLDAKHVAWIMLNPSTADASKDDPTIRRCIAFSRDWGFGGLTVRNLFALRATNPREIFSRPSPVGPDNDGWLNLASPISHYKTIVCAWGNKGAFERRGERVARRLRADGAELLCLGVTKEGHPRHPLYLHSKTSLVPFVEGGR